MSCGSVSVSFLDTGSDHRLPPRRGPPGVWADVPAGSVCRRGPVRLLTGPPDTAPGIARRRAGGRPPPRQGPPASRRTSRRGAAAAAACPGRWRGGDSPLTRSSGIVRRTDVGEGLTLALGHGHLSNNGLHINNLTVNTSTNNHVVSQLCDCAQHCA